MTLAGWSVANPAGLWLAALALPIIALHILKPRRIQATVSALFLWRRVATPVTAARPWQRLTPSWLLAAQVLTALLLALLVARPVKITEAPLAAHTIFVIDASASMQATDGLPLRIDSAIERAKALREQMPAGGEASIVVAGPRARAVLTRSEDAGAFGDALDTIDVASSRADFSGAFALAAGLNTGERPTQVVLISDGGVTGDDLRTAPVGTRYERVGDSATNRGISQLSVEPSRGGLVARVTVAHFGGPEATQTLRVDIDGRTIEQRVVTLAAGEVINESFDLPFGTKVEAFLASEDVLDLDDRAVATVARRPEIDVLVIGESNPFLDAALNASPSVNFTRQAAPPEVIDADVVIFDRVAVPPDLRVPIFAIAAPGGIEGIDVTGTVDRPSLTLINAEAALVQDLDVSQVRIVESQRLDPDDAADVILGAEGAPLLVRLDRPGSSAIALAFALDDSTLPLQAAFPVLVDRIVTDLARAVTPPARLIVGQDLPIDVRLGATITSPLGTSFSVPAGSSFPAADIVGFWTVQQQDRAAVIVAVNADRFESAVAPVPDLPFEEAFEGSRPPSRGEQPLIVPFVLLALACLVAELLLARRRVGVGAQQWTVAQGLRAAVAVALLAVLFAPSFNRSTQRVATVFLVDASDSVGTDGALQARVLVREALESQPEDSLAGIVVFGGDARLESLVAETSSFEGVSVIVDPAATDLSAAMRLGAAALPGDARGRLVLLSDGRATTGDAAAEAQRLQADGVPLDVVVLEPVVGNDVAVAAIDVPPLARAGEAVPISVELASPAEVDAEVTLRRGTTIVGVETLTLAAGTTTVTFLDTVSADDLGVLRYQVDVDAFGDSVAANDLGFAAVPVEGAARVLVVEGRQDAGDGIIAALIAGDIAYDRVEPAELPAIDELAQYASILLVDVDRRDLADAQVRDLTAAVRDLGRGMVVIGGRHSYALGGYRESDLEELLPVLSEITDPLRRQTVAEVLAIDTSGSMDACHCDEEGNNGLGGGNRIGGGVSKTSIARNAAARAIGALSATDQVGVLSVDANDTWLIDLQARPSQDVVEAGLSQLVPDGPTFVDTVLSTSAEALRASDASLKHIIFFTDGFTEPAALDRLTEEAAELFAEGITISVVATGEGAAEDLRPIADAGGGRFYPGRNLEQLPDIIVQEAILASRDFVNEGDFAAVITSAAPTVAALSEAPRLSGYVATTAKPTARVDLRIGPDEDPLLASWRIGLGRVTAWTSDGNDQWAASWAAWGGAPDQWAAIIKETFPLSGDGGVSARVADGQLELRLEGTDDWPDRANAAVRVATPSGESIEVTLERLNGSTFASTIPADEAGTYAVGATVAVGDEVVWSGIGLTSRSYPAEYAPRPIGRTEMERLAGLTGGRVDPLAVDMFDPAGTEPGSRRINLAPWLLLFAVVAWPIAVAVSRLTWRRGVLAVGTNKAAATVQRLRRSMPNIAEPSRPGAVSRPKATSTTTYVDTSVPVAPPADAAEPKPAEPKPSPTPAASDSGDGGSTLDQLLNRKREDRDR